MLFYSKDLSSQPQILVPGIVPKISGLKQNNQKEWSYMSGSEQTIPGDINTQAGVMRDAEN